jgi:hypothetical protein
MDRGGPLKVDKTPARRGKDVSREIGLHAPVNRVNTILPSRILKVDFRKDQIKGGRDIPGPVRRGRPEFAVLSKLIAGDYGPL